MDMYIELDIMKYWEVLFSLVMGCFLLYNLVLGRNGSWDLIIYSGFVFKCIESYCF